MNPFKLLTCVFVAKLLIAVVNPAPENPMGSPDEYTTCRGLDDVYRLIHRGFCYYVAENGLPVDQEWAKVNACGRKGRLALPNDNTIVDFIVQRLTQLISTSDSYTKAWIGLEQKQGEAKPNAGWYFEGPVGHLSNITTKLFFYNRRTRDCANAILPNGCVAEFRVETNIYKGCTGIDWDYCWCSTAPEYKSPADTWKHCGHDVTDGDDMTEDNEYQTAVITSKGHIAEEQYYREHPYTVCQYKEDKGGLLQFKGEGRRIGNGISVTEGDISMETCAINCYKNWACAAISYLETKKLCHQHSIPVSHPKVDIVLDEAFSIWDHEL